nr:MAG TPA: hypothetical protein [Caudoviricetes sp.]
MLCYTCEECRWYDGNEEHKSMWKQGCKKYIVTNKRAEHIRRKFKII